MPQRIFIKNLPRRQIDASGMHPVYRMETYPHTPHHRQEYIAPELLGVLEIFGDAAQITFNGKLVGYAKAVEALLH